MKINRLLFLFLAVLAVILAVRCSKNNIIINPSDARLACNGFCPISKHTVHEYLLKDYLMKKCPSTKANDIEIDVITGEAGDTLMYIVNYGLEKGWEVISADTRTPAVIAAGNRGYLNFDSCNPGLKDWLFCTKEDMQIIVQSSDDDLSFSEDEIEAHKQFWGGGQPRIKLPDIDDPGGGSWYTSITTVTEVWDSISHMTATQWDQDSPYNEYCPYRTDTIGRAPAGCVAIAGAQMLYYLHYKIGVPSMIYTNAYCYGDILNHTITFTGSSSTIWDDMDTLSKAYNAPAGPESILIAFVGARVQMDYGNTSSGAETEDLVENVFNLFGIDCVYDNYDASIVKSSLLSGLPVILSTKSSWLSTGGHAFIIDGYKRYRTITTEYHYWMSSSGEPGTDPLHEPYEVIHYSSPSIEYFKMNWGWWEQWQLGYDDGWYAPTGDWYTQSTGDHNNYYRKMIYGFNVE